MARWIMPFRKKSSIGRLHKTYYEIAGVIHDQGRQDHEGVWMEISLIFMDYRCRQHGYGIGIHHIQYKWKA
jgi:hypothetical protein